MQLPKENRVISDGYLAMLLLKHCTLRGRSETNPYAKIQKVLWIKGEQIIQSIYLKGEIRIGKYILRWIYIEMENFIIHCNKQLVFLVVVEIGMKEKNLELHY